MLTATPAVLTNVDAFAPFLRMFDGVLISPKELGRHWGYTDEHLCNLRKSARGPAYIKLASGGIRYRASEILAAELSGTCGALTIDRVCEALAACTAIPVEARKAAQDHVRAAFATV